MEQSKINTFFNELKLCWNQQNEETVKTAKHVISNLLKSEEFKKHLTDDHERLAKGVELYRDNEFGFVLIAYSEALDFYRVPHNHGNAWVVYSVVEGAIEMGTYSLLTDAKGNSNLIRKEKYQMHMGDEQVYFPADIHDTKCISDSVIILRLTSCDLKEEEQLGRMKRFQKACSLKN